MVFEDLTHDDFVKISQKIPSHLTFKGMKSCAFDIESTYKLTPEEAMTVFFIAQENKQHYRDINKIISRRVADLDNHRWKNNKQKPNK